MVTDLAFSGLQERASFSDLDTGNATRLDEDNHFYSYLRDCLLSAKSSEALNSAQSWHVALLIDWSVQDIAGGPRS